MRFLRLMRFLVLLVRAIVINKTIGLAVYLNKMLDLWLKKYYYNNRIIFEGNNYEKK